MLSGAARADAVGTGAGGVGDRADRGSDAAGEGQNRATVEDFSGSSAQRTEAGEGENCGAGERGSGGVCWRIQPEVRERGAGDRQRFSGTRSTRELGPTVQST